MDTFNRLLYVVSALCVFATALLFLVAIWAEIAEELLWKLVGSGCVLLLACGIMLAINFQILKIKAEIRKTE